MNDQQRAAMRMAIDALERHTECYEYPDGWITEEEKAITALREALAQPQGEPDCSSSGDSEPVACPDKGPWEAQQWGTEKVVLLSDDFEHDVTLVVKGDFVTEDRFRYASQLAAWMNHCLNTPQTVEAAIERERLLAYAAKEMAVAHAIEATKEKAAKVCENTREVQYFSTYNKTVDDAVATLHKAAAAIRSMK